MAASSTLNATHPDFKLTYELALIEHLGLNLYSEVDAALSELIANAYDAEAPTVTVTLPLGVPLGQHGQQIVIADTGHGMTYAEARDLFLRIGRNRRRTSTKSKNRKRTVIGKKGIGKLAGFGIANEVTVSTVSGGRHTEFTLRFQDLETAPVISLPGVGGATAGSAGRRRGAASKPAAGPEPDWRADAVREYRPRLTRADEPTSAPDGTTISLSHLRPLDPIDVAEFKQQLARKFAVFGDDFKVTIRNAATSEDEVIEKFDVACQFRFPEKGWGEAVVAAPSGRHRVRYWIGFTKGTIKDPTVRGISVVANGKSVQEPFEFQVVGGVTGQFGLQYMTGEVVADWIDEQKVDVVASDRASVRWSDPDARALLNWGKEQVRACLDMWVKLRAEKTTADIKAALPDVYRQIEAYHGEARRELEGVVDRVVAVTAPLGDDRTQQIVASIVTAFSHDHIRRVLQRVAASDGGFDEFVKALAEWEVIDAVLTFQELSVKLTAIETLRILVDAGATEVKSKSGHMSLAEHLAENPWLIDPTYREMEHELNVDNFVRDRYGYARPGKDDKRADFIALYGSSTVRIVELKSAKDPVDLRGLNNLMDYHHRVQQGEAKRGGESRNVRSLLVYNGEVKPDALGTLETVRSSRDQYEVWTWRELLERNTMLYKEQLKRVHTKNPTDPRVVALWKLYEQREGAASSARDRRAGAANRGRGTTRGGGAAAKHGAPVKGSAGGAAPGKTPPGKTSRSKVAAKKTAAKKRSTTTATSRGR